MNWTPLDFGKYKGKTLPQVLFSDPEWFFWACAQGVFKSRPKHRDQASALLAKAKSIKVPQTGTEKIVAEYVFHPLVKKFAGFDLVPDSQDHHVGSSPTRRLDYIDLSIPYNTATYDKLGGKLMIQSLKRHLLGGEEVRMTRKRCEEFFNDNSRFHKNG